MRTSSLWLEANEAGSAALICTMSFSLWTSLSFQQCAAY